MSKPAYHLVQLPNTFELIVNLKTRECARTRCDVAFASQKALIDYAERNGLVYLWEAALPNANRCSRLRSTNVSGSSRETNTKWWMYRLPVA
jgi:hypothetical protein